MRKDVDDRLEFEGFCNVGPASAHEEGLQVGADDVARDEDHPFAQLLAMAAPPLEHLLARHVRHAEVEQHDVELFIALAPPDDLAPAPDRDHTMALRRQEL